MKREEQMEVATAAYINGRLKNNVPPEEIEEIRLAYQAGFICADEHPNLYSVTRKAVERERKHLIDKVCKWLDENMEDYTEYIYESDTDDYNDEDNLHFAIATKYDYKKDFIEAFKKAMEEQQ
jgi:hypothetical protein